MMMLTLFFASTLFIAEQPQTVEEPPIVVPARRICRTVEKTGSRMGGRRICKTVNEWKAEEEAARKFLGDRQNSGMEHPVPHMSVSTANPGPQ
jgi:hypothetical protein